MVNSWIWKVYITLCFILLCFIYTCNGTSRMEIHPLKFTYTKSNQCPRNRRKCNGNEPTSSACKPVFGFQAYYRKYDIAGCTPIQSSIDDKLCPFCKYTNPLPDLHSGVLKEQSPLIFRNSTKMPVALYTVISYGDKTIDKELMDKCVYFKQLPSVKGLNITEAIIGSCYSLDFRISISCDEFFYGDNCDIECHPSKNSSTEHYICDENGGRICGPGWRGQNCTEVDYCFYSPCENNGTCLNNNSYYECRCSPEFTGHNCSETTFTTESIPADKVPFTDFSPTLPVTTTASIKKSTEQTHGEVNGNQQPTTTTTTEKTQNSSSTSTVQSTETGTSVDMGSSTEISTMSFEPSSTGCINQYCSEGSTVPTKEVTFVVSPETSTAQARNTALPTSTVVIAGASGGGVILIAVIAVVFVIRLRKRNRELKKKFEREIKETDSNSFLRKNPLYGMSFPPAPNTKEDKKEEEKKEDNKEEEIKLEFTVGNGYTSYL